MKVSELIETLQKIENKNLTVCFSYDSRVCGCAINIVEIETKPVDWFREESAGKSVVMFRSEEEEEYKHHNKRDMKEGFKQELLFAEWENI